MSRGNQESTRTIEYEALLDYIREARLRSGFRQKRISERLGKARGYLYKVESGQRRLDVVEFVQLCRAMDLDPVVALKEYLEHEAERLK